MKILKIKETKELLSLLQEIQTLSHVTGQVTDSVRSKLAVVEKLLDEMNAITQLSTHFHGSTRQLTEKMDDLKSLVVSKNS